MKIRQSTLAEIDLLMPIYDYARDFMRQTGNQHQWINGYPSREVIQEDIRKGQNYVIIDDENDIIATFCFFVGHEPTYDVIYNGQWLNDEPYGVVHRLAGLGKVKGMGDYCLQWCFGQHNNIRVDTHHDNTVMQKIFLRNGFRECGIIYLLNGTERKAYHKI